MSQEAGVLAATDRRRLRWIRTWIVVLMAGLVVSGVTAFPLDRELAAASVVLHHSALASVSPDLLTWVDKVSLGLAVTYRAYPFVAYGTDWLAFAHLVIAVAFIGPLRDPVRNVWVLVWGMIACVGVIPLALIAGAVRGLPLGWQLIDISFGVVGIVPLIAAYILTRLLERSPRPSETAGTSDGG